MTEKEYQRLVHIAGSEDAVNQAWAELKVDDPRLLIGRARRRVIDEHRRRRRFSTVEFDARHCMDTDSTPSVEVDRLEAVSLVRNAIGQLPPRYRQIAELRWLKELSPNEIAQQVRAPVQTVYSRLRRASDKLRVRLTALNSHSGNGATP